MIGIGGNRHDPLGLGCIPSSPGATVVIPDHGMPSALVPQFSARKWVSEPANQLFFCSGHPQSDFLGKILDAAHVSAYPQLAQPPCFDLALQIIL
ncbi:MAG: hypothetical protein VB026_00105 [Anaerolineaceae bacterium]|nr:hypothetical protein [Anaerolineaceae bacterium]